MNLNRREKGLFMVGAAVCLGSLSVGQVLDTTYQRMSILGIDRVGSYLVRYDFTSNVVTEVGQVRDKNGNVLDGIEASAYIPGHTNIYGFWKDPADGESKILYINTETAAAAVVGAPLGQDEITGAVAMNDGTGWQVYAIKQPAPIDLDFKIDGGRIVPDGEFATKFTVLGADSFHDTYEQPVTVKVRIGDDYYEPFGAFSQAVDGNIHDHTTHHEIISGLHAAGDSVSIVGQNWIKSNPNTSGTSNSHWEIQTTVTSTNDVPEVIILRDGDEVPNIDAFLDPSQTADYLVPYINHTTRQVELATNQAIYLFELGASGASSASADFQDLAMLVTIAPTEQDLIDITGTHGTIDGEININPNNSPDNEFTLEKIDGSIISRDELHQSTVVDVNGVYYEGPASTIKVKPKGSGNQNYMTIDGAAYTITNANLYTIEADLTGLNVRIYNDNIQSGGKAMGHWWIEFASGSGTVYEGDPTISTLDSGHIVTIDHQTGAVTELMALRKRYDSLASADGAMFYASGGGGMYAIDPFSGTEILIGAIAGDDIGALECAGTTVMGFDATEDHLVPLDSTSAAAIGTPASLGIDDLGTMIFMDSADDPAAFGYSYD